MNDAINFLDNIQTGFRKMKFVSVGLMVVCAVVSVFAIGASYHFAMSQRDQVYVLDNGSVLEAFRTDNAAQRDLEVADQLTRFLQLFFNVAPNATTIEANIAKALELSDASASDYYFDLREKEYYTRLIGQGISQSIDINPDSVFVNINTVPYQAEAHGDLYTVRSTNISRTPFVATCTVTESQRTRKNVHGLIIERFRIEFGTPEVRGRR